MRIMVFYSMIRGVSKDGIRGKGLKITGITGITLLIVGGTLLMFGIKEVGGNDDGFIFA